ncbi:flagellar type III secretion system pore protein FliP [Spirobacillus cienkowskii]|jgi:flagellar biosynthetic protein FliP
MRLLFLFKLILISFFLSFSLFAQDNKNNNPNNMEKNWQGDNKSVQNKLNLNENKMPIFSINIANGENQDDYVPAIKVLAILTLLTFGPAILLLMSSFTRILIVLSFLRQALGTPTMPPNQIIIAISLFLTYFVMSPTITKIYDSAIVPYMQKDLTTKEALEVGQKPLHEFMMSQVKSDDLKLFYQMSKIEKPMTKDDVPMRILVPSFVISELKSAFQIGFLVYLPFIVIDMIVSSVLMAMGMMMLPPTVVSLPLKLILFVVVDGWNLLAGSLIKSFN